MSDPSFFQRAFGEAMARPEIWPGLDRALARALCVHANTAAKAAQDAVIDNYPVLAALVGEPAIRACAAAFVQAHPPRDPRLCLYGAELASFLSGWSPFADLPWLVDVARLERLVTEALFAADAPPLDGAAMADRLDLARPLTLHPAVRFAGFASPAPAIWLAHQSGGAPDALEKIEWRASAALITRPAGKVEVTPIEAPMFAFLEIAADGRSLAEAAVAAGPVDIATLFSRLITAGAFA